jgi:hypothetical protein
LITPGPDSPDSPEDLVDGYQVRWYFATSTLTKRRTQALYLVQDASERVLALTKTRTAEIVAVEDGAEPIVVVRIQPGVLQTLDDARVNVEACIRAAGNRRCRLLIDIRKAEILSAEVRHYYSGGTLTECFSAIVLLVEASPLGRVMGNLYLRIARPGVPTRLFTDEDAALTWLRKDKT